MAGTWVWIVSGVAALILLLSFAPLPGYYNVTVRVSTYEVGVLVGTVFGVDGVSGGSVSPATVLDWQGFGLGFSWGLSQSWTMRVCLTDSAHTICTQKSASQWFGSVPVLGSQVTATNSFELAYVPSGHYTIDATLTGNGGQSASGSGSVTVG